MLKKRANRAVKNKFRHTVGLLFRKRLIGNGDGNPRFYFAVKRTMLTFAPR